MTVVGKCGSYKICLYATRNHGRDANLPAFVGSVSNFYSFCFTSLLSGDYYQVMPGPSKDSTPEIAEAGPKPFLSPSQHCQLEWVSFLSSFPHDYHAIHVIITCTPVAYDFPISRTCRLHAISREHAAVNCIDA